MKDYKVERNEKPSFFSGKGFYIALALSIVAVGGAAWIGVNSSLDNLSKSNEDAAQTPSQVVEQKEWDIPAEETAKPQSEVPAPPKVEEKAQKPVQQGFIMPLKGDVINPFSGDKVVKSKTLDEWIMHTGIDIGAKEQTPVKAVNSGTVIEVKNDDMWGGCVVIAHSNGVESYYYNLKSAISVKKNQVVKLGDVIGVVGNTAQIEQAEESHLHFAVKKNGEWVDPASIL